MILVNLQGLARDSFLNLPNQLDLVGQSFPDPSYYLDFFIAELRIYDYLIILEMWLCAFPRESFYIFRCQPLPPFPHFFIISDKKCNFQVHNCMFLRRISANFSNSVNSFRKSQGFTMCYRKTTEVIIILYIEISQHDTVCILTVSFRQKYSEFWRKIDNFVTNQATKTLYSYGKKNNSVTIVLYS